MAFTTTTGENGTDYIGSEGVDALFVLNDNSGKILVDALGGGDNVDLTNETGVIGDAEVKLGEGNDTFTTGANDTNNNRLKDSTVNGGPGNDNITTEGTIGAKLRGNEGDDDFFLTSNYTNSTVNGNSGQDSFTLNANVTLSDSKILGGSGNDGQMDFSNTGFSILAVDSVIQGGKGLDTITIGNLTAGLSNFRVSGGADNDTIAVANTTADADGAAYNGAAGDDSISFAATNAADASSKGGDGNERYTIAGTGSIGAAGEAGDDLFVIAAAAGARNTVTGGAGADTYTHTGLAAGRGQTFTVNSVSESAAATTGTAITFDTFTTSVNTAKTNGGDIIDLSTGGTGEELVGNRLNADEVIDQEAVALAADAVIVNPASTAAEIAAATITRNASRLAVSDVTTFAALKTALDGNLAASDSNVNNTNTGQISLQLIEIDAGGNDTLAGIDGFYAILNNTNNILDSGDMMFKMATVVGDGAGGALDNRAAAATELAQIAAAIEAGF